MKYFIYCFTLLICLSCSSEGVDSSGVDYSETGSSSKTILTEQKMLDYLKIYNELKKTTSEVLELVNENESIVEQQEQLSHMKQIIERRGMGYDEFVALSAKIGTTYSILEANMGTYEEMKDNNQNQMQDMINTIQESIDDPDVPEAQKEELRAALEQAQAGKEQMDGLFDQNREKAAKMYKKIQAKVSKVATQEEVAIITQYEKELKEAFQGLSRPSIQGSL